MSKYFCGLVSCLGVSQFGKIKKELPSATNTEQLKGKQNLGDSIFILIVDESKGLCQGLKENIFSRLLKRTHIFKPTKGQAQLEPLIRKQECTPKVGFLNTVEGCILINCGREIFFPARNAFRMFPYETQKKFLYSPQNGEFLERAQFWKTTLHLVLPDKEYREAMIAILRWYRHIKQIEKQENIYA